MNNAQAQLKLASILLAPLETEKSTRAGDRENSVAFRVKLHATKPEIKKAVECFFPEVKVKSVRTSIRGSLDIMVAGRRGKRKKQKIAFVKLEEGCTLNFAEN